MNQVLRVLLGLLVASVVGIGVLAAFAGNPSTVTVTNEPVYAGNADFHVHLGRSYQQAKYAVFCYQYVPGDIFYRVWAAEYFLTNEREQDVQAGPLKAPAPIYYLEQRAWDPELPANCDVVLFKERNGGQGPVAISETVSFDVPAQ